MDKRNPSAINARSRKADMYAEIERLRALLDAQDSEVAMLKESNARLNERLDNAKREFIKLRTERDALRAKSEEPVLLADLNTIAKRCATLLNRSTRVRDGRVQQYVDGAWGEVPQRVMRYAAG